MGTQLPHGKGHSLYSSHPSFRRMPKLVVQGFGFCAVVHYTYNSPSCACCADAGRPECVNRGQCLLWLNGRPSQLLLSTCSKKTQKNEILCQCLATSGRHNSQRLQIDGNLLPNDPSMGCLVFIFTVGINSQSFP